MKRILILLVALVTFVGIDSASAQSRNSYFMEGSYFRNDMNPALTPTRGYIALPGMSGVGVNMSQNFISVDNFFYKRDGELVTALHGSVSANDFLGKLPKVGKLALDTKVNILGAGFYNKGMYWTFGVNANVSADMAMSMDLFKVLKTLGNGTYDLGNTAISANAYLDAYVGAAFRVHENVKVGAKVKFLMGIASLEAQFSELQARVYPEKVDAVVNGTFRGSGIMFDNSRVGQEVNIVDMLNMNVGYMLDNINSFGAAFDVGAEANFLDNQLKVSAAITDLGFICWAPGTTNVAGTLTGNFEFNGVNVESEELDSSGSFKMAMREVPKSEDYVSMLNFSFNAGVEYNILDNRIAFGLLSHTKVCNTMAYSELTASVNFRPLNWLSATVSHTFLNRNRPGIFGFALNIHPCGINIYTGLDFIDSQWVNGPVVGGSNIPLPRYMKSMNAYIGIGFNLARPKYVK